jgi:PAS domain S-box-containing protein
MSNKDKTKEQLVDEIVKLRQRIAELKKFEVERRRIDKAWREKEDQYHQLIEICPETIAVHREGKIVFINKAGANLLGATKPEQLIGKSIMDFLHPDYREAVKERLQEIRKKRRKVPLIEEKFIRLDGKEVDVEVLAIPFNYQGKPATLAIARDITEKKRAEAELRISSRQWQSTFDSMKDSVSLINLEGRILRCNVAMEKFLGKPANEIIGSFCWKLIHGESEPIEGCPVVRMKETHQRENKILQLDDRWLEVIVDPQFDDDKKLIGAVHIISDITERKRMEKELMNSREKLRNLAVHIQSEREEERIKIAHEIHDEMAQSLIALKMDLFSLSKKIPKDQKSLFKKIESMSKLTDDIIKLAKEIYTELRPSLLDDLGLPLTIEWEAEEFQKRTGIRCEISIDPEIPALDKARSTAIFRIFEEILTNIMRHAKATKVKVSLRKKDGKLELNVRDNGKGITRKQLTDPKSFGLIGIRERAKSLGGEDKIRGVPGKGTTVTIRIPLKTVGQELE